VTHSVDCSSSTSDSQGNVQYSEHEVDGGDSGDGDFCDKEEDGGYDGSSIALLKSGKYDN
jgi:hypothetical protein